jgi:hypothetical protein
MNQDGLSPNARSATKPQDPKLLARLDPLNDDEEIDAIVDACWEPCEDKPPSFCSTDLAMEPGTKPNTEMDIPITT